MKRLECRINYKNKGKFQSINIKILNQLNVKFFGAYIFNFNRNRWTWRGWL